MLFEVWRTRGMSLVFDDDDVLSHGAEISIGNDPVELPAEDGASYRRYEAGQQYLKLDLRFKPGRGARWVPTDELTKS